MIYPKMLQQHTEDYFERKPPQLWFCISSSLVCPANAVDMNPALTTGCSSEGDDPARNDRLNGRQRRFVANLSSIRGGHWGGMQFAETMMMIMITIITTMAMMIAQGQLASWCPACVRCCETTFPSLSIIGIIQVILIQRRELVMMTTLVDWWHYTRLNVWLVFE